MFHGHESLSNSTIDEWDIKWETDTIYYHFESDSSDILGFDNELKAFRLAALAWTLETNLKIRQKRRNTADAEIQVRWSDKEHDELFKKRPNVLAYAYYPSPGREIAGDITFNDSHLWSLDGANVPAHYADPENYPDPNTPVMMRTYDVQHTTTHELGHALGLKHSNNACRDCVMYPMYNGNRNLRQNDKDRIQKFYEKASTSEKIKKMLIGRIKGGVT